MDKWNCDCCLITVKNEQKDLHCKTNRHRMRARIKNYCDLYERLMKELESDKILFNYSLEECEEKESEIIKELDELLTAGIFDNQTV